MLVVDGGALNVGYTFFSHYIFDIIIERARLDTHKLKSRKLSGVKFFYINSTTTLYGSHFNPIVIFYQ